MRSGFRKVDLGFRCDGGGSLAIFLLDFFSMYSERLRDKTGIKPAEKFDPSTDKPPGSRKTQRIDLAETKQDGDDAWTIQQDEWIVKEIVGHKKAANARNMVGLNKYEFKVRWDMRR